MLFVIVSLEHVAYARPDADPCSRVQRQSRAVLESWLEDSKTCSRVSIPPTGECLGKTPWSGREPRVFVIDPPDLVVHDSRSRLCGVFAARRHLPERVCDAMRGRA